MKKSDVVVVVSGIRVIRINKICRFLDLFEAVEAILGIPPISYAKRKIDTLLLEYMELTRVEVLFPID